MNASSKSGNRAAAVLASWCKAAGIQWELSDQPGCEVRVTAKDGTKHDILFSDDNPPPQNGFSISPKALLDPTLETALKAFQKLTEGLGYVDVVPVNRGEEPTERRLNQSDDFELISLRHKEFRAAPNLTASEYGPYMHVVVSATKKFRHKNWILCNQHGLTLDDLWTYGLVWATNFIHKYLLLRGDLDDNRKLLTTHLKQRFAELARNFYERHRRCVLDKESYLIATTGTVDGIVENMEKDLAYIGRHKEIDTKSRKRRKETAEKLLKDRLAALPHDEMVDLLINAIGNAHFEPDARDEAARQLDLHEASCSICASKIKEKIIPIDPTSALELFQYNAKRTITKVFDANRGK